MLSTCSHWALLGSLGGVLGLSRALLGLPRASWGSPGLSWGVQKSLQKTVQDRQGDPDMFFAMIFEHFFFDAQKSLQKTVQDRPRAPRGGLRRRFGPVSDVS